MDIVIKIPNEFEKHFKSDRFEDSLSRVASDIESFGFQLAGRYEKETITMLREAFKNCIPLPEQKPCEDCISREEVMKLLEKEDWADTVYGVMNLPSVTPTRSKGKWIILDECANEGVYCSECHKKVFKLEFSPTMKWRNFKYCPNCGAEMEVEANDD